MIKRKADVKEFIYGFCLHAKWDGKKFYFVINLPEVTITLMQYTEGYFTIHRISELLCDIYEIPISEGEITNLIWKYRKYINQSTRVTVS
ncbi:hypothetical protein [Neobacillus cucumis]|uniref:Uncharacterized protein n=1 Tax=Neobacillus cucumis TaxID=1740721 RepID=A0A2N5HEQ8_9BACI|nr:hypothetical protein [Neobacillus cucumis]PLS04008.1 hypothetical protein CVD27_12675 [Neobacillus cucumis]